MVSHKFAVGDRVRFIGSRFDGDVLGTGPAAAAGCGRGAAAGSRSWEAPGRNKLAGVAMSSAWCGRAWL